MLIDKSNAPEINDIVTIKLLSGEEIVGKLVEKTTDFVFLSKPIHVVMGPVNNNQVGLSMYPVLSSVNDPGAVQFPMAALSIRPLRTGDEVKRKYIQITTGLLPASADQIPSRS